MTHSTALTNEPQHPIAPEALGKLVDNHAQFLAFLQRRVRTREIAEDILQQAFTRAMEHGGALQDAESATAWFYRLLRNALTDHYRRQGAAQRAHEALAHEEQGAVEDPSLMDEVCRCVGTLIDTLNPAYAEILRRVDLESCAVPEFARETGISASNAGVRLHRAREALFRQLVLSCGTCTTHGCLDCTCEQASTPCGAGA